MVSGAPRWDLAGRSVRGASHVREGMPNQDAFELGDTGQPPEAWPVAAVADGHGGARHFRSALGAQMAVQAATHVLRELAPRLDQATARQREALAATDLPERVVDVWATAVLTHLVAHPIEQAEWQALCNAEGDEAVAAVRAEPLLAYGATLLCALLAPHCTLLAQLGDGDILAVDAQGRTHRPVPSDDRLGGNLTTSICRPGAERDFRCVVLSHDDPAANREADPATGAARHARPALLLLSTDGYANSFRTDADFLKVGTDYLALVREHTLAQVASRLDEILEEATSQGSGDDITLVLLHRVADAAAGTVDGPAAPVAASAPTATAASPPGAPAAASLAAPQAELQRAQRQLRQMRRLVALLLLALALAAGWHWRSVLSQWLRPQPITPAGEAAEGAATPPRDRGLGALPEPAQEGPPAKADKPDKPDKPGKPAGPAATAKPGKHTGGAGSAPAPADPPLAAASGPLLLKKPAPVESLPQAPAAGK